MQDGQIISWTKEIFHECPFKRIASNNLAALKFNTIAIILIPLKKWAFRPIKIEEMCSKQVIQTSEGLYLVSNRDASAFYSKTNIKEDDNLKFSKTVTELILADRDFRSDQDTDELKLMFEKGCADFVTMLRIFELSEDRFLTTKDWNKNDMVLYTKNGHIYQPNCVHVQVIFINEKSSLTESSKCYRDLPVTFIMPGQDIAVNRYLTNQGVIREETAIVDCPKIKEFTTISGSSVSIGRLGQQISVVNTSSVFRQNLHFFKSLENLSLDHSSLLTKGVDVVAEFEKIKLTINNAQSHEISQGYAQESYRVQMNFATWIKYTFSAGKLTLFLFSCVGFVLTGYFVWRRLAKKKN